MAHAGGRAWRLLGRAALALALLSTGCAGGGMARRMTSQPTRVAGMVLDRDTGRGIRHCSVSVPHTGIGTRTDEMGRFVLTLPDTGRFEFETRSFGYGVQTQHVRVAAGRVDTMVFRLKWDPPTDIR